MRREPTCTPPTACPEKSLSGQKPVRTNRILFLAGIRDLSLYPVDRRLQSLQNQSFFISNCSQPVFSGAGGFLPTVNDGSAGLTVFRPVRTGMKGLSTDSTPLLFSLMK